VIRGIFDGAKIIMGFWGDKGGENCDHRRDLPLFYEGGLDIISES